MQSCVLKDQGVDQSRIWGQRCTRGGRGPVHAIVHFQVHWWIGGGPGLWLVVAVGPAQGHRPATRPMIPVCHPPRPHTRCKCPTAPPQIMGGMEDDTCNLLRNDEFSRSKFLA